jgi:hypothetical protein
MMRAPFCFFLYCIFNSAKCQAIPTDIEIVPYWNIVLDFFANGIKMEGKEVLSMKISLSFVGDALKKHRRFCTVVLTAVALLGGAVLGIVFERNVGISLSDRLARRIGTTAVTVDSCVKSGSALTVTLDFPNVSPEKETMPTPDEIKNEFSPQNDWNFTNYGIALEAVHEELTSGPFSSGIDSVTIVCQHEGKTMTTITGDRVPKNASASADKSGKTPQFFSFDINNADGSNGGMLDLFFQTDSSQPTG